MTILIADDSPNDRLLLRLALEAEQHTVIEAIDGVEALAVLEREPVDAVISDILMPRMDGYRLCDKIRKSERFGLLPFIHYSASYTSPGDIKLSLDMGADKFLSKSAPASEIIEVLGAVTTARRSRREPMEPAREMDLMKDYNRQLVAKLEEKNDELRLRNQELLNSQQQLLLKSTALESIANAAVITDLQGIIVWVNPAFTTLTGYREDEVIGKTPRLLKSGKHSPPFYKNLWDTVLAGRTWRGNFLNRRKDGSLYEDEHTITPVLSKEGKVTHFVAIMNDVTKRKRAELASHRLAAIVEFSDDAIIGKDLEGVVTSWNFGAEKIFGYSAAEMVGVSIKRLIPPERQNEEEMILERINRGESVEHFETVRLSKDGRRLDVSVTVSPIKDANGRVMGASKVARDITARKKTDESLKLFRNLIDHSNDAVEVIDPATARFLDVNETACRRLGYSREELLSMGVPDIENNGEVTYDSWPAVVEEIRQAGFKILEGEHRRKDGSIFPVEINVQYIRLERDYLLAVVRDVSERKEAEEQLRSKTALLEAQLNSTLDGILIVDKDGRKILQNQRKVDLWKIPRELAEDADDRRQIEWVARQNKDPRQFIERVAWLQAHPDEIGRDELELVDGRFFERYSAPVRDTDGKYYGRIWVVRDITESKRAEVEFAQSQFRYRSLFENMLGGYAYCRILYEQGRASDYVYLEVNTAFESLTGLKNVVGKKVSEIIPGVHESNPELIERYSRVAATGRPERFENYVASLERWFSISVYSHEKDHFIAIFDNITERKRSEQHIAEQAALLDQTQDAIIQRDIRGKILFWSKGAERIYGWTREEAVGGHITKMLGIDPKHFEENNPAARGQEVWTGEHKHFAKDRRELIIDGHCTLIRDDEGRPKSVLVVNTDITEKKKIEAQFMRAQRMESIGTLAGGVAHDLNNILAPIMMSIDILKETVENPQAKAILDTIDMSAKRGADIVRQVLSFARGLDGERIEVQPGHLIKDLEHIIKNTFPKNIELELSTPKTTWTILGDPTQLHQILLNLCVNARDAMPLGGRLSVRADNHTVDDQYAGMNARAKAGPYVVISVTDTGTGIPEDIIEKIFDPFFTTKGVGKGTGLGLSTVMAIVKGHEGFLNVYSEPGQGTTFKIYLPAASGVGAAGRPAEEVSLPRGRGETILLVDDEASILTVTSQTLEAFGYKILTATDGADALATYVQHEKVIAAVLTDMAMPVMDGGATIHALLRINPKVKIIAASGLDANEGLAKVSGAGIKYFLSKPYTAVTLLKTLRAILEEE